MSALNTAAISINKGNRIGLLVSLPKEYQGVM